MQPRRPTTLVSHRLAGCFSFRDAVGVLARAVESRSKHAQSCDELQRIEVEIDPTDILRWLAAQGVGERSYFRNREGSLIVAGVGRAFESSMRTAHQAVESIMRDGATAASDLPCGSPTEPACEPFFFHADFFDATQFPADATRWSGFDSAVVTLPIIEMRRTDESVLAVHFVGDGSAALDALERCHDPLEHLRLPSGLRVSSDGDPVEWADGIDAALGAIAAGSLEKVVLARTRGYSAIESIDPCAVLGALMQEEPAAFHFLIESSGGEAFVGASPERLFRRSGHEVQSEALAGTCGRGPDGAADDRLAGRLLSSDKNRREHEIVIRHVESVLAPFVMKLTCDESPRVMRLRHVQHLRTSATGVLTASIDDRPLLDAMHPTPAVCGWPVEAARNFIRQHERVCRGMYAGIVGVASSSQSDYSVAIRSALIVANEMIAYSGAGIVRGSDADAEWLETERKLSAFDALVVRAANEGLAPASRETARARTDDVHTATTRLPRLVMGS